MNKPILIYNLLFICLFACNNEAYLAKNYETIRQLNTRMEIIYEEGNASELASFYATDAMMIGPDDQLKGQAAIREFWSRIDHPVTLNIKKITLHDQMDSLKTSVYWQEIVNTTTNWPPTLKVEKQEVGQYIFQLSQLTLEYEREDVTYFTNKSIFLWIWERQKEGYYRIKLDCFLE